MSGPWPTPPMNFLPKDSSRRSTATKLFSKRLDQIAATSKTTEATETTIEMATETATGMTIEMGTEITTEMATEMTTKTLVKANARSARNRRPSGVRCFLNIPRAKQRQG